MSQYFVNMNTEVSNELSHLINLKKFDQFKTSPDEKCQIELRTDEIDVERSDVASIKLGVANTTNYVFLIEREDRSYGSGSASSMHRY